MRRTAAIFLCVVLLVAEIQPAPLARAQDDPPAVGEALATWSLHVPRVFDAGSISMRMLRLGSPEGDAEVVSTWRDLRVDPLAQGPVARAPRVAPSLLPPQRLERPTPIATVVRDDMRTSALFWPGACSTGRNVGTHESDGLRLAVTGPCYASSSVALIEAFQPDVTVGDGEARIELRVERGWDRALVSLTLLAPDADATSLTARIFPAAQMVGLLAESRQGVQPLATRRIDDADMHPDSWTSFALERVRDRAWLLLNDEPVLAVDAAPTVTGTVVAYVSRLGPVDDDAQVAVMLRDFTASTVEGGDAGNGVERAARPLIDPRYARILTFIRSDLADDPGADSQAAERRAIGRAILDMIEETHVNLEVTSLPEVTAARFSPYHRAIYVDERLMTYTPHVATMLLLHEIVHAHQELKGLPRSCIERELDTATWESRLWRAWFGPEGKQPPGDEIEAEFSAIVQIENQGRLREAIEDLYHEQCADR